MVDVVAGVIIAVSFSVHSADAAVVMFTPAAATSASVVVPAVPTVPAPVVVVN